MTHVNLRAYHATLAVICAATFMTIADETIVVVAAPSIQRDLNFSAGELSWVVNAYLIGFGGLLLLAGRVGDLVGRSRVLLTGMSLFTCASLVCALASSPAWLIVARFVQGSGGALASGVALGMIANLTTDELARNRAIGTFAFMGAVGASTGLMMGGIVTSILDWRWAFFINLPIGILVVFVGARVLEKEQAPGITRSLDWQGAGLLTAGLMCLIAAIVLHGGLLGLVSGALLVGFVVRQAVAAEPILPLSIFRSRTLTASNVAFALFVGSMFTFQFLVTLYLQQVLGFSAAKTGLSILPTAIGIAGCAMWIYPRVAAKVGTRPPLLTGLFTVTVGLGLLSQVSVSGNYWSDLFPVSCSSRSAVASHCQR